eukprot:Colp12_sorted_trinity150504_noHs@26899
MENLAKRGAVKIIQICERIHDSSCYTDYVKVKNNFYFKLPVFGTVPLTNMPSSFHAGEENFPRSDGRCSNRDCKIEVGEPLLFEGCLHRLHVECVYEAEDGMA